MRRLARGRWRSLALAACGEDGGIDAPAACGAAGWSRPVRPADELTISQWPLYVDPGKDGTVAQFEGDTGIDVEYVEDINDNAAFFGKMQPLLADGESGGRSMITVSDWLARRCTTSATSTSSTTRSFPTSRRT